MWMRLVGVSLALFSLGACSQPPYENIDNAQLKTLMEQGVPLYDVRRDEEWRQTGIVAGSRTLTWVDKSLHPNPQFIPSFTAETDKSAPVILICRTGNRTDKLARELMTQHGYTKVYNVKDGITRWIGEGHPVVKP